MSILQRALNCDLRFVLAFLLLLIAALPATSHAGLSFPAKVDGPDEASIAANIAFVTANQCNYQNTCVWSRYEVLDPFRHPDTGPCTSSGMVGADTSGSPYTCVYLVVTYLCPYGGNACGRPLIGAALDPIYLHSCPAPADFVGLWSGFAAQGGGQCNCPPNTVPNGPQDPITGGYPQGTGCFPLSALQLRIDLIGASTTKALVAGPVLPHIARVTRNGAPVAGQSVNIGVASGGSIDGSTDGNGEYRFTYVPPYKKTVDQLTATCSGCVNSAQKAVTVEACDVCEGK